MEEPLSGRCDSFVVETDVHFPTDINLLFDGTRKTIDTCVKLAHRYGLTGWRQHRYHQAQLKKQYRRVQKLKHSTSKDPAKRQQKAEAIAEAHRTYLRMAQAHLERAERSRQEVGVTPETEPLLRDLDHYMGHARHQIDLIERRVLQGERIPHEEKIFSIFEPHTEWISKGKAGVPVELGLRVNVVEDEHRFILHHQVMEGTTDEQVAVAAVDETQQRFPNLRILSFDKGYHSPANQQALSQRLDQVVLPKKGRLSQADQERENDPAFKRLRRQHSAVESAINGLEQGGLDICPDHGIDGFKRYVALAVVARNCQRLGAILRQQDRDQQRRKRRPADKAA